jgi:hypothetical protein
MILTTAESIRVAGPARVCVARRSHRRRGASMAGSACLLDVVPRAPDLPARSGLCGGQSTATVPYAVAAAPGGAQLRVTPSAGGRAKFRQNLWCAVDNSARVGRGGVGTHVHRAFRGIRASGSRARTRKPRNARHPRKITLSGTSRDGLSTACAAEGTPRREGVAAGGDRRRRAAHRPAPRRAPHQRHRGAAHRPAPRRAPHQRHRRAAHRPAPRRHRTSATAAPPPAPRTVAAAPPGSCSESAPALPDKPSPLTNPPTMLKYQHC